MADTAHRQLNDQELRAFADTYTKALAHEPYRAMTAAAKEHGISRATAHRWADRCRGLGYLSQRPGSQSAHSALITVRITPEAVLRQVLDDIVRHDTDYQTRYVLVFQAVPLALQCGYAAGIRIDPAEPEWPVVYIELPTGQVSWHMPQFDPAFDGHTTDEKFARIRAYLAT